MGFVRRVIYQRGKAQLIVQLKNRSSYAAKESNLIVDAEFVRGYLPYMNRIFVGCGFPAFHEIYSKWEGYSYIVQGDVGSMEMYLESLDIPKSIEEMLRKILPVLITNFMNENGRMCMKTVARNILKQVSDCDKEQLELVFNFMIDSNIISCGDVADEPGGMQVWFGPRLLALDRKVKKFYSELERHCAPVRKREYAFSVGSDEENFM